MPGWIIQKPPSLGTLLVLSKQASRRLRSTMPRRLIPILSISQCVGHKLYHSVIYSLTFVSSSIESSNEDDPFWKSLVWQWPNRYMRNCWRNSRHNFIITRLNEYSVYIHCSSSCIGRSCEMAWTLQIYSPKSLAVANCLTVSAVFLMCLDLMTPTCQNPQYLCNLLATLQIHSLRSLISTWTQQNKFQSARPWLNGGL